MAVTNGEGGVGSNQLAPGLEEQVHPDRSLSWFQRHRSSVRLAFILQIVFRAFSSLLALVWAPLLLGSMGKALYGQFLSFQSVASLGGLGDLGMGGAVNIQVNRLLGQRDHSTLQLFLASARGVFLIMSATVTAMLLVLAPWFPSWLRFEMLPGAGSLTGLFALGALGGGLLILSSYITNLNYGCSNLTWPVMPAFLLLQLSFLGHWLLARQGSALWVQYIPYVVTAAAGAAFHWIFVRLSHPPLAALWPPVFERQRLQALLEKSFWVYLCCLGPGIVVATDRLLINAGFGAERVTGYQLNFKLCELALFVISSATLVSLPKITQWVSSREAAEQERAAREMARLNKFQTFVGCAAALVYLMINDTFITLWLGRDYLVPLSWQAAFAANMAVTAAGYAGFFLSARCGDNGVRIGGIGVALSTLLKVGLSFAAMQAGSILGIALATVVSQSCVVLALSWFTFRQMKVSFWHFALKGWLVSLAVVGLGLALRVSFPPNSVVTVLWLSVVSVGTLIIVARALDIKLEDVRQEMAAVRSLFAKA